jgi:hypothetical protein
VAERPNAPALKADVPRGTESSNLSRSAHWDKSPGHGHFAPKMAPSYPVDPDQVDTFERLATDVIPHLRF